MSKRDKHEPSPPPKRKETPFHAPFAELHERARQEAAAKAAAEKAAAETARKAEAARKAEEARKEKLLKSYLPPKKPKYDIPKSSAKFDLPAVTGLRDGLSDEALFRSAVEGARALPATERVAPPKPAPVAREVPNNEEVETMARLADLCAGNGPFDLADTAEYIEGTAPGVDHRLVRRLRAGEFSMQAHLDLHGSTREEARVAVDAFITRSRAQGLRCVLLIHGRGLNSKDNIPVLKQSLAAWLQRGRLSREVLAFSTARPHDGGAGALYLLLRR